MNSLRLKTILRKLLEIINDTDKVNTISPKTEKFIKENGYSRLIELIEAERAIKVVDGEKVIENNFEENISLNEDGLVVWKKNGKKYTLKRVGSKEIPNLEVAQ